MKAEDMIARAEQLEAYARQCRTEGIFHGPEGAEDAEQAAQEWREAAGQQSYRENES